jgi:hypothetical protein
MSDSKRKLILAAAVAVIDTATLLKHAEGKKITPVDIETTPLPAAFVYSGPEQKVTGDGDATIGYETWRWRLVIEVWIKGVDPEDVLKEIHDLMWTNRSFGNLAVTSERVGATLLVVDDTQEIEALLIDFDVLYRHTKGVM